MIRVTVELLSARTGKTTLLGRAFIANDVRRTVITGGVLGDYSAKFTDKADRTWNETKVKQFPRKRLLAWDLLYRSLDQVIGWRNK